MASRIKTSRRWLLAGLLLLIVSVALYAMFRPGSSEAAKYKAELRARGEKISFEELGFPKPQEDLSPLWTLTNAIKRIGANYSLPGLGLMTLTTNGRASITWNTGFLNTNQVRNGAASGNLSIREACERSSNDLAIIRIACQQPIRWMYHDPIGQLTNYFDVFIQMRRAAQWLAADGLAALQTGDTQRAIQDIESLAMLGDWNADDPKSTLQRFRVTITGFGLDAQWELLQYTNWNDTELAAMQRAWEKADLSKSFPNLLTGERALGEYFFSQIHSNGSSELQNFLSLSSGTSPLKERFGQFTAGILRKLNSDNDELRAFRLYQSAIETCRMAVTNPWPQVASLSASNIASLQYKRSLNPYAYYMSDFLVPNLGKELRTAVRQETFRRLTVTAIALERFRLRHGKYPLELNELSPEFIGTVPLDLMSQKPPRYKLNPDGSFTLYSIGEDGKDDGGDTTPTDSKSPPDLWNARDAVWPMADDPSGLPSRVDAK